jgi:hypothetical protein
MDNAGTVSKNIAKKASLHAIQFFRKLIEVKSQTICAPGAARLRNGKIDWARASRNQVSREQAMVGFLADIDKRDVGENTLRIS